MSKTLLCIPHHKDVDISTLYLLYICTKGQINVLYKNYAKVTDDSLESTPSITTLTEYFFLDVPPVIVAFASVAFTELFNAKGELEVVTSVYDVEPLSSFTKIFISLASVLAVHVASISVGVVLSLTAKSETPVFETPLTIGILVI